MWRMRLRYFIIRQGQCKAHLVWKWIFGIPFSNVTLKKKTLRKVEVSAEICSEDHEYNMDWPSDITLWINDVEVGTWESPSDLAEDAGS